MKRKNKEMNLKTAKSPHEGGPLYFLQGDFTFSCDGGTIGITIFHYL